MIWDPPDGDIVGFSWSPRCWMWLWDGDHRGRGFGVGWDGGGPSQGGFRGDTGAVPLFPYCQPQPTDPKALSPNCRP